MRTTVRIELHKVLRMRFFLLFLLYAAYCCNCAPSNAGRELERSDGDAELKPLKFPENYNSVEDVKRVFDTLSLKFFVDEPLRQKKSIFRKVWTSLPWRTKYKKELKDACATRPGISGVTKEGFTKCTEICGKMNEDYINYVNKSVLPWMVWMFVRTNGIRIGLRPVSLGTGWCAQVKNQQRYKCKCRPNFEILANEELQKFFDNIFAGKLEKNARYLLRFGFLPKFIGFIIVLKVNIFLLPAYLLWLTGMGMKKISGYHSSGLPPAGTIYPPVSPTYISGGIAPPPIDGTTGHHGAGVSGTGGHRHTRGRGYHNDRNNNVYNYYYYDSNVPPSNDDSSCCCRDDDSNCCTNCGNSIPDCDDCCDNCGEILVNICCLCFMLCDEC